MAYTVSIKRLPIYALFDLKGSKSALNRWVGDGLPNFPDTPNHLNRCDDVALCSIGPCRWLLIADLDQEAILEGKLKPDRAPPDISIVRISDTQTFFQVTGEDAEQVLSIGTPLDLHPAVFGDDAVSRTEFFGVSALMRRTTGGFEVAVEQSFGDMIEDYLTRALE